MKTFSNEAYFLFFSTLANRTCLAILDSLKDGPKTMSEISKALDEKEAIVVQNLKALEKCVIVTKHQSGDDVLYSLNKEVTGPISEILSFHVNKYCPRMMKCIPPQKLKEYMKKEAEKSTYIEHE